MPMVIRLLAKPTAQGEGISSQVLLLLYHKNTEMQQISQKNLKKEQKMKKQQHKMPPGVGTIENNNLDYDNTNVVAMRQRIAELEEEKKKYQYKSDVFEKALELVIEKSNVWVCKDQYCEFEEPGYCLPCIKNYFVNKAEEEVNFLMTC